MSELPSRVYETVGGVQDKLYDEVVANGWFERRPDATRNRWTQTAIGALIGAVVITVLLAAFTTFGLVGSRPDRARPRPDVRGSGDAGPHASRAPRCSPGSVPCGRT